jgi:hypothetical protein
VGPRTHGRMKIDRPKKLKINRKKLEETPPAIHLPVSDISRAKLRPYAVGEVQTATSPSHVATFTTTSYTHMHPYPAFILLILYYTNCK